MKHRLIPLSLAFVLICLFDNFHYRLFFSFICAIWAYFFYSDKGKYISIGLILLLNICSLPLLTNNMEYGIVDTIKNNYFVIRNGLTRVVVYSDAQVDYGDEIRLESPITVINSYDNFDSSTFQDYCKGNNIIGSISVIKPNITKQHFSFRKLIYLHNLKYDNQWINALLFSNSLDIESDSKYLVFSAGMHISFLAYAIRLFLQKYFYQDKVNLYTCIIMTLLMLIMTPSYGFVRVLIFLVCDYIFDNKRDSSAIAIMFLCLYKPYYVKSIAFLLPVGIKLISLFSHRKHTFITMYYILMVQLFFFYEVNLLSLVLFNCFRVVFGYLYVLAIFLCWLPIKINLNEFIVELIDCVDKLPSINIHGKYSVALIVLSLIFIFKALNRYKIKYNIYLLALLLVNCNQRLLCPFYTVSYLDVGQGDCAVITLPFSNHAFLIDVGGNYYKDIANDIDIPYLNQLAIKSVDVIISHQDLDHSGALKNLKENFNVLNVYDCKKETIKINNLEIINPMSMYEYDNDNDNSLLCYFKIDEFYFMFMGDVSKQVEYDLTNAYLQLEIDVVKLSHHGSNTASSDLFLSHYHPKLAIISAGRNNRYNHPHNEIIERLNNYLINYLNTQVNKGIRIIVGNHFLIYKTSNNKSGIYVK